MRSRYPDIEPYASGHLDVGDGNLVYWETCGAPDGKPAVVVHGGPGSGAGPGWRRWFDPAAYRVVLFDQRQCGRSIPLAGDPATDLTSNTTPHLIADIERLRDHLGVERWLVFGASWGCALGLRYAELHPERVTELVLFALATGRRSETDLLTRGLGAIFPEAWARFLAVVPEDERGGDLATAYARLVAAPDPSVRERAARAWAAWETATAPTSPPWDDPLDELLTSTRIVTHFWSHGSWMEEGAVLRDAGRLAGIPTVLVQGSLDLGNLIGTPWELASAIPGSELIIVDDGGHGTADPGTVDALIRATDRFATSPET
jgi:proline iminopeptidase